MTEIDVRNLFVVDLETTGTNPFQHEVLAVGIAPLNLNTAPRLFYVHIEPETSAWTSFARSNFDKFADDWRAGAAPAPMVCSEIESYLGAACGGLATAIGHNIGFDISFLRKLAFRGGQTDLFGFSHRALDTHTMLYLLHLKGVLPASALSSDGAFQYFGISVPEPVRHTALADALATRSLAIQLLKLLSDHRNIGPQRHARGAAR